MAHWLMKTEPEDYSWERLVADGETEWSGVRNHQAAANMRAMQARRRAFFYRSMVEPAIVGRDDHLRRGLPRSRRSDRQVRARQGASRSARCRTRYLKAIKADPRFADSRWSGSRGCRWCRSATRTGAPCCKMAGIEP